MPQRKFPYTAVKETRWEWALHFLQLNQAQHMWAKDPGMKGDTEWTLGKATGQSQWQRQSLGGKVSKEQQDPVSLQCLQQRGPKQARKERKLKSEKGSCFIEGFADPRVDFGSAPGRD